MSAHLLAIEIGPVEEFIAAARKTQDLWFGSYAVSEIAKAAALTLAEKCGGPEKLIFPAPTDRDDLRGDSALAVADVLLAEVPPGVSPAEVAAEAKRAVNR